MPWQVDIAEIVPDTLRAVVVQMCAVFSSLRVVGLGDVPVGERDGLRTD